MAKGNRGGRRTATAATAAPTANTAQFQMLQDPPQMAITQAQATAANDDTFPATDSSPFHQMQNLRQYFAKQNLTIDEQIAVVNYLSPDPENGSLYSMSQNLNHAMVSGSKLTANQQFVHDNMMASMHNLGENAILTRYDHDRQINTLLKQAGVGQTYDQLNQAQLRNALVGKSFGEERFLSTSANDFAKAPQTSRAVFTNRAVKVTYRAPAATQAMMPGNGPGGAMGEIVLKPSGGKQNYKIVDVKFTGQTARKKGTQNFSMPQVELVIDIIP